jgi:hypothetical protein
LLFWFWTCYRPEYLKNSSSKFFGSSSSFDFCVYATSLGYLDLCVSQFTVSDERATSADFLLLDSTGIYLVVQTGAAKSRHNLEEFLQSANVLFKPFAAETWMFIIFFLIPVFGILMVVHEYDRRGSTLPSEEKFIVTNENGTLDLKVVPTPLLYSIVKSMYAVTLAIFQHTYHLSVTTNGGMLNLLGISFFILTIIATYTANLAALLSQEAQVTSVSSFEDAIQSGYRFCAERNNMDGIVSLYPNVEPWMFVTDLEPGGDGKPGFVCSQSTCKSRELVFDMLDSQKAQSGDLSYCHASIAPLEDLEVLQSEGDYCSLAPVGKPVHYTQTGFPIFDRISPQLVSFLLRLKNDGIMDGELQKSRPASKCVSESGEGSALSLSQLTGIWIVSFGFAFIGICASLLAPLWRRKSGTIGKRVHKRDQVGDEIQTLDTDDHLKLLARSKRRTSEGRRTSVINRRSSEGRTLVKSSDLFLAVMPDIDESEGRTSVINRRPSEGRTSGDSSDLFLAAMSDSDEENEE